MPGSRLQSKDWVEEALPRPPAELASRSRLPCWSPRPVQGTDSQAVTASTPVPTPPRFLFHSRGGHTCDQSSHGDKRAWPTTASCDLGEGCLLTRNHPFQTLVLVAESRAGPLEVVLVCSPEVCCHLRVCFRAQTCWGNREAE